MVSKFYQDPDPSWTLNWATPHLPAALLVCLTCTEGFILWRPGTCSVISTAKIGVYELPLCLHVFSWPGYLKGWQGGNSWGGEHRLGVFVCVVGAVSPLWGRPVWGGILIWNGKAAELSLVSKARSGLHSVPLLLEALAFISDCALISSASGRHGEPGRGTIHLRRETSLLVRRVKRGHLGWHQFQVESTT